MSQTTRALPKQQDKYNNFSYRVPSPEGTVTIFILEDSNGIPSGIQIFIGKAGSAIQVWSLAFAEIVTAGLMSGSLSIQDIMNICSSQATDKAKLADGGIMVRSGVEALYIALHRYTEDKFEKMRVELGLSSEDSPSSMAYMNDEE